jgi:hypothetical protein
VSRQPYAFTCVWGRDNQSGSSRICTSQCTGWQVNVQTLSDNSVYKVLLSPCHTVTLSSRWKWDPPPPRPQASVSLGTRGGGLHLRGWGSPNSDDWRESFVLCLLCAYSISLYPTFQRPSVDKSQPSSDSFGNFLRRLAIHIGLYTISYGVETGLLFTNE